MSITQGFYSYQPLPIPVRTKPAGGIPPVIDSPAGIAAAAQQLADYAGPIAIDTERASAYRFDDRAFLLQLRRANSPVFLIAPEGIREETEKLLAPVLNSATWILHAAPSDLPSLASLGLFPRRLFDTELAARLLGFSHPNLSAMTGEFLGFELAKSRSADDWSQSPLTLGQRAYAALDVESLCDLACALRESLNAAGKLSWHEQECATVVQHFASTSFPQRRAWHEMKGIARLDSSRKRAAAQAMWELREHQARRQDMAPSRILKTKALLALADNLPATSGAAMEIPEVRLSRPKMLSQFLETARHAAAQPPSAHPQLPKHVLLVPSQYTLKSEYPAEAHILTRLRSELEHLAEDLQVLPNCIATPTQLRETVWMASGRSSSPEKSANPIITEDGLARLLKVQGHRPWQIHLLVPLLERNLAELNRWFLASED